jgi:hypothetical protein
LRACLEDNRQAWELDSDGRYTQRIPDGEVRAVHARLISDSWGESEAPLVIERTGEHQTPRAQQTGD